MFVALIQQGMVLDQQVVATGTDQDALLKAAEAQAQAINDKQTGEAEGYTAVVLPVHQD